MPRENRKRGKKHKKQPEEEEPAVYEEPTKEVGPSWIVSAPGQDAEAPFGYVDADVKAYFRTVDVQLRDWQENSDGLPEGDDDTLDPNAEKHMFFVAALNEMRGKEKQLATDPDCSIILERMAYSMDDLVRRVFLDSLSGSYGSLVKHRFASHVCQTLLNVALDTVAREAKGVVSKAPEDSEGELRTVTELVLDICKELLPSFSSLIMDPFASHVIRALLKLLCPSSKLFNTSSPSNETSHQGAVRSKKSAHWKSRQGPLTSVFTTSDKGKGKGKEERRQTLPEFLDMSRKLVETVRKELGDNEVRALAADKVASPCLLMLLDVEAELNMSDQRSSLMDRVTVGVISASSDSETTSIQPSDYLGTLFRDPTSSHLLETILSRASDRPFTLIWNAYLQGKLHRLAVHPVGNFVVAKALERVNEEQLRSIWEELKDGDVWVKMIATSRTGVLRVAIDRSAALRASEDSAMEAVFSAVDLSSSEEERRKYLVPCLLALKSRQAYTTEHPQEAHTNSGKKQANSDSAAQTMNVQGSLLLQSLLKLSHPHNQPVIDSITSLDPSLRLKIAHNATASRVFDVLLDSETVPAKAKRMFVMSWIGCYERLVDDRIGSRVGDRCWAFADTFLKEKIARSLISQEQFLAGSYYGKFFSRNLNLYLLKRRPDEWKDLQASKKVVVAKAESEARDDTFDVGGGVQASGDAVASLLPSEKEEQEGEPSTNNKRKRKRKDREREKEKDEIDEVFDVFEKKGKKKRKEGR